MQDRQRLIASEPVMNEIVCLLAKNHRWLNSRADQAELCAAREHLQNALHVLERTLESVNQGIPEPACNSTLHRP